MNTNQHLPAINSPHLPAGLDLSQIPEPQRSEINQHFLDLYNKANGIESEQVFLPWTTGDGRIGYGGIHGPRELWSKIINHCFPSDDKIWEDHLDRCKSQYKKRFKPRYAADGLSLYDGIKFKKEENYTENYSEYIKLKDDEKEIS